MSSEYLLAGQISELERLRLQSQVWEPSGRRLLEEIGAEVLALPPGHPYLRLPLQFATSLEDRLLALIGADELQELRERGEAELEEPGRWGTTFTLLQCWGRCPTH